MDKEKFVDFVSVAFDMGAQFVIRFGNKTNLLSHEEAYRLAETIQEAIGSECIEEERYSQYDCLHLQTDRCMARICHSHKKRARARHKGPNK